MSFNIDPKKTGSINDGGRRLKVGTFTYKITGASLVPVKSDPRGKEMQVVIELLNGKDYACKTYLSVMSSNDTQSEIAKKTLVAFWEAAALSGNLKPETLKRLIGKSVVITTKETAGKGDNKDKTFVNISTIEAPDSDEEEEQEEEEQDEEEDADVDTDADDSDEEEEQEEEQEEEKPAPKKKAAAPAKSASKRPWG